MSCSHPKRAKTQYANPGGAFSKTLTTTTCEGPCDAPGADTIDSLGGMDAPFPGSAR